MRSWWVILVLLLLVACTQESAEIPLTPAATDDQNVDALARGELEVTTSTPAYYGSVRGFLAEPLDEGTYPGVILIHEWWGLNAEVKEAAAALASHGYRVLAVDLYNGNVAATPEQARNYTGSLNQTQATENMQMAAAYLRDQGSERIASMGWCFGGGQSLQLALSGEPLDATVIYYGRLESSPDRLRAISWPVLGIFGSEDTGIPVSSVQAFQQGLDTVGVENSINIYDGVGHAFANPSGANFAPKQTRDAWEKTVTFLDENTK